MPPTPYTVFDLHHFAKNSYHRVLGCARGHLDINLQGRIRIVDQRDLDKPVIRYFENKDMTEALKAYDLLEPRAISIRLGWWHSELTKKIWQEDDATCHGDPGHETLRIATKRLLGIEPEDGSLYNTFDKLCIAKHDDGEFVAWLLPDGHIPIASYPGACEIRKQDY